MKECFPQRLVTGYQVPSYAQSVVGIMMAQLGPLGDDLLPRFPRGLASHLALQAWPQLQGSASPKS